MMTNISTCVCLCLCAALCPLGSCFQMTPGSELSLDICISLSHTHSSLSAYACTYECGGLFSAWLGFCHKYSRSCSHTHWQSLTLTTGDGQTDVSVCERVLPVLMIREGAVLLRWRLNPMAVCQQTHALKCDAILMKPRRLGILSWCSCYIKIKVNINVLAELFRQVYVLKTHYEMNYTSKEPKSGDGHI